MTPLFKKLNLKDQSPIVVLNPPETFEAELSAIAPRPIVRTIEGLARIDFALSFVMRQVEVDRLARAIAPLAQGDTIIWFAYPKGSSKTLKCDFNRDTGWGELVALGFETVRIVAIDADWSALRFRRTAFVGR